MAQFNKDTSQYRQTQVNSWYLDVWQPRKVPKRDTDKIIVIPPKYDLRPDLLSYDEYGTPSLWWVFSLRNPNVIIDPINDFVAGIEIYIPENILK